jgi:hypothetical protein
MQWVAPQPLEAVVIDAPESVTQAAVVDSARI